MRRAPEGRHEERDEDDAEREIAVGDEGLEAAAPVCRRGRSREGRRDARSLPRLERRGRRADVERRAKQILRVGAQAVARARRRDARADDPGAVAGLDDDLAPADPAREAGIAEDDRPAGERGAVDRLEAERRQATRPGAGPRAVGERAQRGAPPVDPQVEVPREQGRVAVGSHALALLEGRDLGQVEHVADVERVARGYDRREVVDGEVAERVREGRSGSDERRHGRDEDGEALHESASLATGAQRIEKCGLSASARANQRRASAGRPAQRSA
jgi:hypothetical protein